MSNVDIVEVIIDDGGPDIVEVVDMGFTGPAGADGAPGPNIITPSTESTLGNGIVASDNGLIRLATNAEVVSDAELTAALAPYLTSSNAASTYAALAGATFTGALSLPDGSNSVPALSFASDLDTGLVRFGSGILGWSIDGANRQRWDTAEVRYGSGVALSWSSNAVATVAAADLRLIRNGPDVLEMQRGTNPQGFLLNNTWTSSTNFERGFARWSGNVFQIGTEKGSLGGVARSVNIQTDGTTRWACNAAGDVTQSTMNYTFSGEGRVNAGGRLLMRGNGGAEDCVVVSSLSNQTGANVSLLRLNGMLAATSAGTQQGILLSNTYVQSGASGSTDLRITRTETTIGSGEHLFINFALGSTRQFVVQRDGKPVFRANGAITIAQNEMMSFEATSNTAGNIVYRGSDGVTRRNPLGFTTDGSSSFGNISSSGNVTIAGSLTAANIGTIAGFAGDQNLATTDSPTFAGLFVSGGLVELTSSVSGVTGNAALRRFGANVQVWSNASYFTYRAGAELLVGSDKAIGFSSNILTQSQTTAAGDLLWFRDAAGTLAQRNGTNAQISRIYKTFTSATNFETYEVDASSDASNYRIGSRIGSAGGTTRGLQLGAYNAAGAWTSWLGIDTSGSVTTGSSVAIATTAQLLWTSRTKLRSPTDAQLLIRNNAESAGVILDVSTDAELRLRDRNNASNANLVVGDLTITPSSSRTLSTNGQFSIEMTSNTAGNLVYRGSDGTTRRMALTFT